MEDFELGAEAPADLSPQEAFVWRGGYNAAILDGKKDAVARVAGMAAVVRFRERRRLDRETAPPDIPPEVKNA